MAGSTSLMLHSVVGKYIPSNASAQEQEAWLESGLKRLYAPYVFLACPKLVCVDLVDRKQSNNSKNQDRIINNLNIECSFHPYAWHVLLAPVLIHNPCPISE